MKLRSSFGFAVIAFALLFVSCSSSSTDTTNTGPNPDLVPIGILDFNVSDTTIFITTLDLDQKLVTSDLMGSAPERTADGTIIFVDNNNDLVETNTTGLNKHIICKLNQGVPFDDHHDDHFNNPRLSADRKYIAYEGANGNLYVVLRTTGEVVASWEFGLQNPGSYYSPSWTTDGKIVVNGDDRIPGLYLLDPVTKTAKSIGTDLTKPIYPNVSYNNQICFVMNGYIYTMNLDGTNLKQFTNASTTWINTARYPVWSPNAKWIATFANLDSLKIIPVSPSAAVVNASQQFTFPADVSLDNSTSQISWR